MVGDPALHEQELYAFLSFLLGFNFIVDTTSPLVTANVTVL